MLGARVKTKFDGKKIIKKAKSSSIKSLGHAGAAIRLTARRSIKRSAVESQPGEPPHTRKGQLKRAIVFSVETNKQSVVIGPDASVVGSSGSAHEHGGHYRRERFPKRPFMGPALEKLKTRLPQRWKNSVQ